MYVSELNFRRPIEPEVVFQAVSESFTGPLTVSAEHHGGDFSTLVRVVQPNADRAPTIEQFRAVARRLNRIVITDDVEVEPLFDDGYSLISPDGSTAVIRIEEEVPDGSDPIMYAESRAVYDELESRLTIAA